MTRVKKLDKRQINFSVGPFIADASYNHKLPSSQLSEAIYSYFLIRLVWLGLSQVLIPENRIFQVKNLKCVIVSAEVRSREMRIPSASLGMATVLRAKQVNYCLFIFRNQSICNWHHSTGKMSFANIYQFLRFSVKFYKNWNNFCPSQLPVIWKGIRSGFLYRDPFSLWSIINIKWLGNHVIFRSRKS